MGYQESFITTENEKDFDDFVKRIKTIGKEYYEQYRCLPCFIVTVKQEIPGLYENETRLKANNRYIYFTGYERYLQGNPYAILNVYDPQETAIMLIEFSKKHNRLDTFPFNLDIIFSDDIDCSKIFDTSEDPDGKIYSGLTNAYIEVSDFVF